MNRLDKYVKQMTPSEYWRLRFHTTELMKRLNKLEAGQHLVTMEQLAGAILKRDKNEQQ